MKSITPKNAIFGILIVAAIYSIVYYFVNTHSSFFHFDIFLEGLGTIVFLPLLLTTFRILAKYFIRNKYASKYEWLYSYFVFVLIVAILSIISVLKIFPDWV